MALILRLVIIIPLVLSLVSFVLTTLSLFAGHQKGFMEDYAIVRLNTSMIGENIFKSDDKSDKGNSSSDDGGLLGDLKNKWHKIKGDTKGKLGDIAGDLVGDLADELGVSDWYSLHIMNSCEGNFGPNATETSFKLNVTNCTSSSPSYRFNLTDVLNHELAIGPLKLNLADIQWPDSVQDKIDDLNDGLLALFVFYVLGVGFSGLAMFGCIPAFLIMNHKFILLANMVIAAFGAVCIILGSIIVTAISSKGVDAINKAGQKVTLVAEKGIKFYIISWIAAAFMIITTLFWAGQFVLLQRKLKKQKLFEKGAY